MYTGASDAVKEFGEAREREGMLGASGYGRILKSFHESAADLLRTSACNISFMKNTAEGLSAIASGYPFEPGDEVISYIHEYPSNHYPWLLQEQRGVQVKLLPNAQPDGSPVEDGPGGWCMSHLEELVNERTRIIAISHVQFTSGFASDIGELGQFCLERGIDLVIDAAQSLGCLPVFPEEWHIAAVAGSGWKWLMGPVGCGLLYTSPEFREKLRIVMAGADIVTQGDDYLNHTWTPYTDGRRFEYSTVQIASAAALDRALRDIFVAYGPEAIRDEIFRLQDVFLSHIDRDRFKALVWPRQHRSGILALACENAEDISRRAIGKELTVTSRGGFLRIAPHFYNDDNQLIHAAELLSTLY